MNAGTTMSFPATFRACDPFNTCKRRIPAGEIFPDGHSLGNILHDLKTPLNGIVMSLELLKTAGLSGEPEEWLRTAVKAADVLGEMLMDLESCACSFSPASAKSQKGNLLAFLQTLVDVHKPVALGKGLEINFFFSPELHDSFAFCESRWRRIVGNLLTNAVKFTPAGYVSLYASVENADLPDTVEFCIKVEDSGCGIAEEDIHRIYEPFFRGTPADGSPPGKGLGLCIVKSLLEEMGGKILVQSRPAQGTTFLLRSELRRIPTAQDISHR